MAARSELAALAALGERLRATGSPPAAETSSRPYAAGHVAAGLTRLRALVGGESPDEALTDAQMAAYAARYRHENAIRAMGGRFSGWGADVGGQPQCAGCRALISHPGAQCKACGFMGGAGYVGTPAKTSHLERWR